jgi:hypothetical protein
MDGFEQLAGVRMEAWAAHRLICRSMIERAALFGLFMR